MKLCIITLGCKVNQYESDKISYILQDLGYECSQKLERADCYIINTCAVTAGAFNKSKQFLAKVNKLNVNAEIIVIGCASENSKSEFLEKAIYVQGNEDKISNVINFIKNKYKITKDKNKKFILLKHSRHIIKVQDGCNNFCSYCLIPYLRGRSKSRTLDEINKEVSNINGEIVLTGINLSSYGLDIGSNLTYLMNNIKYAERKRLGSLECNVISKDFLEAVQNNNFAHHFHLSLQSGSNKILKLMNRHYNIDYYIEKCEMIRNKFSNASITTDIIVGFPNESDEDFFETCNIVRKIKFESVHIFPYSSRKGTEAYKFKNLDKSVLKERIRILKYITSKIKIEFLKQQIGSEAEIFVDKSGKKGYTSNYVQVLVNGCRKLKFEKIKINGIKDNCLFGEKII